MTASSRAIQLRRAAAPAALVLGGLLAIVEGVASMGVEFPEEGTARLAALEPVAARLPLIATSFLLSQLLLLGGALGVVAAIRGRGAGWANAAGALILAGAFGHAVVGGIMLLNAPMLDAAADRAQMAALLDRTMASPLVGPWFAAGLLGFALGFLLLGVAVGRARLVPAWAAWMLPAALVAEFAGGAISEAIVLAARVAFLVALAVIARALWSRRAAAPPTTAVADPGPAA